MGKQVMRRFETAQFVVQAYITEDEDFTTRDFEPDLARETQEKLDSGEWQVFGTVVTVTHKPTGIELGHDSLWGSVYADPCDFFKEHVGIRPKSRADGRNYGSYFSTLISEAVREARRNVGKLGKLRAVD